MKPKTPKHKTYTVHKKPAKKAEWKTIEEVLKETPVSRPPVQILPPSPGMWNVPDPQNPVYETAPWWVNPNVPPPILTCNTGEETK